MDQPPGPEDFAAAVRHHRAGELDRAEDLYRRILDRDPGHADALHLLGVLDHQRGRDDRAVDRIARAIALDSSKASYHNNHGVALKGLGRVDEAMDAYRTALRLSPDYADAHSNLAVVLHDRGDHDRALGHFEAALQLQPDHVDALFNLGNLLHELGRDDRAVDRYRRAHALVPGRVDVLNNLGNALLAADRADEAIVAYRRALERDPASAEALANLGTALAQQDRHEEALASFAAAARLRPGDALAKLRMVALCPAVFPDVAAIDGYRADLEAALDACGEAGLRFREEDLVTSGCVPPFALAHHGRDNRRLKAKFAALFAGRFPAACHRPIGPGAPRIGFVVTRGHEGIFLRCMAGIIDRLTPGRFRPVILGAHAGLGALRARIRHPGAEFVGFPEHFPAAVAAVGAARCDLLYHWEVGTDPLNYFLPMARLAPVQCTSWGTQVTSGVRAVDYYLSAALIERPEADDHYTETLVRLPTLPTYQERPPRPSTPPDRDEFGLPPDRAIYLCPQSLLKLHPDADALLAGVLRRDPRGLVVLKRGRWPRAADLLTERFRATIPDVAERIVFVPWQDPAGYYRLLATADVVLDTPHFGAGSTTYDVLGLGLPLVTLPGEFNVGRYAQACYRKMGMSDLIADSPGRYAELAAWLGTDRAERDRMAARIAAAGAVLFEDRDAVAAHEAFFERALATANGRGS